MQQQPMLIIMIAICHLSSDQSSGLFVWSVWLVYYHYSP